MKEPAAGGISQGDFLRIMAYVQMPDYQPPGKGPKIRGTSVKAVAREVAVYADWTSGENVYPRIATLALGVQMAYRTVQHSVAALVAWGLLELTEDTRGYGLPNGYRLRNPYESAAHAAGLLQVLTPEEFEERADALYRRSKGRAPRRPRRET